MTRLLVAIIITLFSLTTYAISDIGLDTSKIEKLTGLKGKVITSENVFKVYMPREDLKISLSGVNMKPTMGLSSWVSFKQDEDVITVTGTLALADDQISPVMEAVLKNGLKIKSLENHYMWETPKVMFMEIQGSGDSEAKLAQSVGNVVKVIKSTRDGTGSFPLAMIDVTKTNLNHHLIDNIFNKTGSFKDGVYKVVFGNSGAMEMNTWAAFAGSDKEAVVIGDFVAEQPVLDKVLMTLQKAGIYIVSIHPQVSSGEPQIVFLHYVGIGTVRNLANGIHAALQIKPIEEQPATDTSVLPF